MEVEPGTVVEAVTVVSVTVVVDAVTVGVGSTLQDVMTLSAFFQVDPSMCYLTHIVAVTEVISVVKSAASTIEDRLLWPRISLIYGVGQQADASVESNRGQGSALVYTWSYHSTHR